MANRKRQVRTRQFKEQAVALALAKGSDRSLADVAKGLGVPPGTLAYWVAHPPADAAAARVARGRGGPRRWPTSGRPTRSRCGCSSTRPAGGSASWRSRRRF